MRVSKLGIIWKFSQTQYNVYKEDDLFLLGMWMLPPYVSMLVMRYLCVLLFASRRFYVLVWSVIIHYCLLGQSIFRSPPQNVDLIIEFLTVLTWIWYQGQCHVWICSCLLGVHGVHVDLH